MQIATYRIGHVVVLEDHAEIGEMPDGEERAANVEHDDERMKLADNASSKSAGELSETGTYTFLC